MFDKQKYDYEYTKNNYHRVNLLLPKEYKDRLDIAATQVGMSKNAFIRTIVEDKLREMNL